MKRGRLAATVVAGALLAAVAVLAVWAHPEWLFGRGASPVTARVDRVLVLKAQRRLLLLSRGRVVRRYRVALGFNPVGHKIRRGDGRTPEGTYVLDWRNPNSQFQRSIHVSYPNRRDRLRAARRGVDPGGAIMIHGVRPSFEWLGRLHSLVDWTDGCIAVSGREMAEIWVLVPNGTPIEIRP
jgi:murein L,D-transpeptidase YafK